VTTAEPDKGTGPAPPEAPVEPDAAPVEPVTIRDKRKVSLTGGGKHAKPNPPAEEVEPPVAAAEPSGGLGAELAALRTELDERTRDLQRVTADFANYRKRKAGESAKAREDGIESVFKALLPVFDDLDRAREHGDLSEGMAAVVDQLVATTAKFGVTAFGEKGDPFDPNRHEAVAHQTSPEVSEPTCVAVLRRGYLLGNRLLRPAMVAVADPEPPQV
jgi:molecular chaperone GrpE